MTDGGIQAEWTLRCFDTGAFWFDGTTDAERVRAQAARWPDDGGVVVMGLEVRTFETSRICPSQFEARCKLLVAPGCKTLEEKTAYTCYSAGYHGYVVMVALYAPLRKGALPSLVSGVLKAYAIQGRVYRAAFLTSHDLRMHGNLAFTSWEDWLGGAHSVDTGSFMSLLPQVVGTLAVKESGTKPPLRKNSAVMGICSRSNE